MTHYHAVLLDETRCEFGAGCEAESREAAREYFREMYPESQVVQIESPEDRAARESAMYDHISRGGDYDDDGRPIMGPGYDYGPEDDDDDIYGDEGTDDY